MTAGGAIALVLLTYWTAIFQEYGRLDDYFYVHSARTGTLENGMGQVWFDTGRPVPSVLYTWVFPQIESVANLSMLRLTTAFVLALGATLVALVVFGVTQRRTALEHVLAVGVAGVALTTTATPSAITWAVMAGQLPALSFAVAAGLVATWGHRWWHWVLAALLVFLSAFAYQHYAPIAFFVSTFATAALWARRQPTSWWRPFFIGVLAVAALAANYAFVVWRGTDLALSRVTEATWGERLHWFGNEFLPRTVDVNVPWSMQGAAWSAALALVLMAVPTFLGRRYLALPVAVVVSWLCTAVVILPGELWASYRLVAPAQFVLWVGAACCAAVGISGLWQRRRAVALVLVTLASVGIASGMYTSHHRAVDSFAAPSAVDWESTKCAVRAAMPIRPGQTVEQNDWGETTSPVLSYDEYGAISTANPWALPRVVWLALDDVNGPPLPRISVEELVVEPPNEGSPGALVISAESCGTTGAPTD